MRGALRKIVPALGLCLFLAPAFDRAARRFELEYTGARVGGGRFRLRAGTQVFVPRRQYPHGYDVRVTGGQALSRRNAANLRVRR